MAERGDASPQDIDTAMELGAGYREFLTMVALITADPCSSYGRRYCVDAAITLLTLLLALQTARLCRTW